MPVMQLQFILLTSFGGPNSRMSCLFVGIKFTLTFSNGSMTSLNTLSWPSMTTSCQSPDKALSKEYQNSQVSNNIQIHKLIKDI